MFIAMRAGFSALFGFAAVIVLVVALIAIVLGHQFVWRTRGLRSIVSKNQTRTVEPALSTEPA